MQSIHASQVRPPFYRDERVLGLFSQILVVVIVLGLGLFFFSNMLSGLREKHNVAISFSFLGQAAGFDIGESLIEYSRERTYGRAVIVGLLNTFQVAFLGIVFASALGIVIGIMRLSTNFLVNRIAAVVAYLLREQGKRTGRMPLTTLWFTSPSPPSASSAGSSCRSR
jgi:general L-amino acid transport system permease protein